MVSEIADAVEIITEVMSRINNASAADEIDLEGWYRELDTAKRLLQDLLGDDSLVFLQDDDKV